MDGCKGGWVAVALEDGAFAGSWVVRSVADLHDDPAVVIGVDTPLGHAGENRRQADVQAKKLLGPRQVCVFHAPAPAALLESSFERANAVNRAAISIGLMKQAWELKPWILDATAAWSRTPNRIYEVHPEVSFSALNHHEAVPVGKRKPEGEAVRRDLLVRAGVVVGDPPRQAFIRAAPDDLLDAAVAAWSARRIANGEGVCVPDPPQHDADGRAVAIWY